MDPLNPPRLRYRPVYATDLPECVAILPAHLGLDAARRSAIGALWQRLWREPSVITGVVEDLAKPAGARVQAWGVTLALPRPLVEALEIETAPRAFLSRRIYDALLSGELVPMSDREFGLDNARGELTLYTLHYSQRHDDLGDAYGVKVLTLANDTFRAFHEGYQLRAIFYENHLHASLYLEQTGFVLRRWADAAVLDARGLPADQRPALYGLTRAEAASRPPGTLVRNCFEHVPPRYRFNATQRRLLLHALFEAGDDTLQALLEVSPHGLKKLWRAVYERIEDVTPEFFGDTRGGADDDGKRGPEKRRQVLAYVRQRPEELRPWALG